MAKSSNFLPSGNDNMLIFLFVFFTPKPVKSFWHPVNGAKRLWKIFNFGHIIAKKCCTFFNVLYEIVQKYLKLENKRENSKEIHPKQVKYSPIIDRASLILSHWNSSLFLKINLFLPPPGGFRTEYLPLCYDPFLMTHEFSIPAWETISK